MTTSTSMTTSILNKWFWNEDIWLPANVTWSDLELSMKGREGVAVAKFSDLWYPMPAALLVIGIRLVVEK